MFQLVDISDTCRVDPDLFNKPMKEAVSESISERYVDKVIDGVGLAVMLYEVFEISEGFVYHGEVLQGYVLEESAEGVRATVEFFDDIFIPRKLLQQPSEFDEQERVWVWRYGENDLFLDAEDDNGKPQPLLFRVVEVEFNSRDPSKPPMKITSTHTGRQGSLKEDGLGLTSWWDEGEEPEEEEEEEGEDEAPPEDQPAE